MTLPPEHADNAPAAVQRRRREPTVRQPKTRRNMRSIALVLAMSSLSLLVLGSWSFGSSVGSAPDDQVHMASIWCSDFAGEECEVNEETGERFIPSGLKEAMCTTQNPYQSAGCQPMLNVKDPPMVGTRDVNTLTGAYPAGFYQTMNLLVRDEIEIAITSMRLLNSSIFVALATALWVFLPTRLRRPLTWGWLITLTPLGFFLIASVNPSSWAVMSVGFGWIALLGFLESPKRNAIALGVIYAISAAMAFSSRTDSAVFFLLTSALAVFLSPVGLKELLWRVWLPVIPLVIALGNLAIRGLNGVGQLGVIEEGFGTRSLEEYGEPLPWAKGSAAAPTGAFDGALLWNNIWDVPALWLGFVGGWPFGSLGWLDTLLPQFVPFALMFAIAAVVFTAMGHTSWRKKVALIGIVLGAWALPVYLLQLGGFIAGEEFQPRYLLPIFTVLVMTALIPDKGAPALVWGRFQIGLIWLAVTLAHSVALHTGIRRYTTGYGLGGVDLDRNREWWWLYLPDFLSATLLWILGTLAFGVVSWFALMTLRSESIVATTTPPAAPGAHRH